MNKEIRVCTLGGGTGMPVINQALVNAGFTNLKSVVTTFDNGGDTGRLRTDERGQVLAFSDYWRALISLWKDGEQKKIWEEMLRYRDGRDRNFGNMFFKFMSEKTGNLSEVESLFKKLTLANLAGKVVPVSLFPADVCFETQSGKKYHGEYHLDELRMSRDCVKKLWLEPEVKANPEAIKAIEESELIIICPGSVFGSLITNFLPKGIKEAFKKSRGKKILMVNLMMSANEGDINNQNDYKKIFENYLGSKIDQMLMADMEKLKQDKLKKSLGYYELENSLPVKYIKNEETIIADIATIDEINWRLRHSVSKLSKFFEFDELCPKKG